MYGLEKLTVYVEKHPIDLNYATVSDVTTHIPTWNPNSHNNTDLKKIINTISINHMQDKSEHQRRRSSSLENLDEKNQCGFVTRNNYALFTSSIHLECNKALVGRFIYIQMDGRNNRWSRLFSAVFCEIQAYEV